MKRGWFRFGIIGAGLAALCCTTPIAVVALGWFGLGSAVVWIDIVVIPALLVFVTIAIVAYKGRKRG